MSWVITRQIYPTPSPSPANWWVGGCYSRCDPDSPVVPMYCWAFLCLAMSHTEATYRKNRLDITAVNRQDRVANPIPMSHHWLVSSLTSFFCICSRWLCLISLISLRMIWISSEALRCISLSFCWSRCCILTWPNLRYKLTKGRDQLTSFSLGQLTIHSSSLDQLN